MNQNANFFKLGMFIIVSFTLGTLFLIIFGAGQFFKKELLAETCFNESVQGLSVGSEVKYKGIRIGTVKSITSASQTYNTKSDFVLVIISLEEDISLGQTGPSAGARMKQAIEDGLSIRLAFKGLTGAAYLETDYLKGDSEDFLTVPWPPENMYIPSHLSNIKQYGDALNQILENLAAINLQGISVDIQTLLTTLDKKANDFDIRGISTLTASLISELKDTNQKVGRAIESDKVKQLLDDAQTAFADIRQMIDTAKPPVTKALNDFQSAAGSTKNITLRLEDRLAPKIENLAKSLEATSTLLENMIWLNADRIKQIIENLETTSENLKQMSRDLKLYPGKLLFEKPPEKKGTQEVKP